ncbi:MAG: uridine diphosphate-N-acetylglucosamine-binding protein YvcK [archaeon]
MKIKAVIFDLDDTLFDCSGMLVENARKRSVKAMVKAGLNLGEKELMQEQKKVLQEDPKCDVFELILRNAKLSERERKRIKKAALKAYNSDVVEKIKLFPDVMPTLRELKKKKIKLVIITSGLYRRQMKKVRLLKLNKLMDLVLVHDIEKDPSFYQEHFLDALKKFNLKSSEVAVTGDRLYAEIKTANKLGMHSIQFMHGRFRKLKPENELEKADYKIRKISEVLNIIKKIESLPTKKEFEELKVVAIGGGTGLPNVLFGLKKFTANLTAIVTVTDSGRSSGRLRRELNVLPPGDIRNCLVALSDSEKLMKDLFQYRFFGENELNGHSFGNLFIAALAKLTGSFEKGIEKASNILAIKGRVLPSTLEDVYLCAELKNGEMIEREEVIRSKALPIKKVFLKPSNAKPLNKAVKAIMDADAIVIGPGSLFTSIIPNLLVNGIPEAIKKSKAKKIYVSNIVTQPDQTKNFTVSEHVKTIEEYLGKRVIDFVIINNMPPPKNLLKKYREEDSGLVKANKKELKKINAKIIEENLIEKIKEEKKPLLWEKKYLLRHDPFKLAECILRTVKE